MILRNFFAFLRTTSTILTIVATLSFGYEVLAVPGHNLTHTVQKSNLQTETGSSQITTDHCDLCRTFSFLTGNETFLPKLQSFTASSIFQIAPVSSTCKRSLCIIPPSRAPPVA